MSAEDDAKLIIAEAEAAADKSSSELPGKIKTTAYYSARKAFKKSPQTAVTVLISHVPVVGPVLGAGSTFLKNYFEKKAKKKKGLAAISAASVSITHAQNAKALAKYLSQTAAKIDENITKFGDAEAKHREAVTKFRAAAESDETTYEKFVARFWDVAYAYYLMEHYNVKLAKMTDDCMTMVTGIAQFIESEAANLEGYDKTMVEDFVELSEGFEDPKQPLLGRGRSSSSY